MKSATISRAAIKKALIDILKKEPDILKELQKNYPYPINVATKDDIKMILELMDKRFESIQREMDKRFESLIREMNARFEAVDKRFEAVNKRLNLITWVIGIGFTLLGGALITLIGLIIHLITKI